jgi:hypothetical protein
MDCREEDARRRRIDPSDLVMTKLGRLWTSSADPAKVDPMVELVK